MMNYKNIYRVVKDCSDCPFKERVGYSTNKCSLVQSHCDDGNYGVFIFNNKPYDTDCKLKEHSVTIEGMVDIVLICSDIEDWSQLKKMTLDHAKLKSIREEYDIECSKIRH